MTDYISIFYYAICMNAMIGLCSNYDRWRKNVIYVYNEVISRVTTSGNNCTKTKVKSTQNENDDSATKPTQKQQNQSRYVLQRCVRRTKSDDNNSSSNSGNDNKKIRRNHTFSFDNNENDDNNDNIIGVVTEAEKNRSAADRRCSRRRHQVLLVKYLVVYLLATFADWLQGPYIYALYAGYGYSQSNIAILFVTGYASSMIFGPFLGNMADYIGRRTFVIIFAIVYAASHFSKHFKIFSILLFGRVLGGIATSLLHSVFDAWLIRAHDDNNIKSYIGVSFSWTSYMNSIVAILAGLIANYVTNMNTMTPILQTITAVDGAQQEIETDTITSTSSSSQLFASFGKQSKMHIGGFLNPFDIALVSLCLSGLFAYYLWEENYGDTNVNKQHNKTSDQNVDNDIENDNNIVKRNQNHDDNGHDVVVESLTSDDGNRHDIPVDTSSTTIFRDNKKKQNRIDNLRQISLFLSTKPNAKAPPISGNSSDSMCNDCYDRKKINDDNNGKKSRRSVFSLFYDYFCSSSNTTTTKNSNDKNGIYDAIVTTIQNREILLCGIISSLFEGSMYIFVFMWTPALLMSTTKADEHVDHDNDNDDSQNQQQLPFGLIFSTFMVCCMAGSSFFNICLRHTTAKTSKTQTKQQIYDTNENISTNKNRLMTKLHRWFLQFRNVEQLFVYELCFATVAMVWIAAIMLSHDDDDNNNNNDLVMSIIGNEGNLYSYYSHFHYLDKTTKKFLAMNLFEFIVGMYWPTINTIKSQVVPENKRTTIYNLYRVPLNMIVLCNLIFFSTSKRNDDHDTTTTSQSQRSNFSTTLPFILISIMLGIASLCSYCLYKLRTKKIQKIVATATTTTTLKEDNNSGNTSTCCADLENNISETTNLECSR